MMTREEQIADLHERYVKASGRPEPLRFHREAWLRLATAPEYGGDVERLSRDVGFIVWYLKRQIARDKRNPGALRLRNLLQPDQFLADLAEAIAEYPIQYRRLTRAPGSAPTPLPQPSPATEELAKQGAARLREFAEKLRK